MVTPKHIPPFTGLVDEQIDQSKPKVFISYSRKDRAFLKKLLDLEGFLGCVFWCDPYLIPGQRFWHVILQEINKCDVFIFVVSPTSIQSIFCIAEFEEARRLCKPIIPILIKQKRWFFLPPRIVHFPIGLSNRLSALGEYEAISLVDGIDPINAERLRDAIHTHYNSTDIEDCTQSKPPTPFPKPTAILGYILLRIRQSIISLIAILILGIIAFVTPVILPLPSHEACHIESTVIERTNRPSPVFQEVFDGDTITALPEQILIIEVDITGCELIPDWTSRTGTVFPPQSRTITYATTNLAGVTQDILTLRLPDNEGDHSMTLNIQIEDN